MAGTRRERAAGLEHERRRRAPVAARARGDPMAVRAAASRESADDEGAHGSLADARAWLAERRAARAGSVERIALEDLDSWRLTGSPVRLEHHTGRFFKVEGYTVRLTRGDVQTTVEQPLINQPEVGILGFLARRFDGTLHLLVQAKMEPGNVAAVQLAPTLQATHSNYTRAHGGRSQPLLEHFRRGGGRVLVDELQPEQAAYFLRKHNRNMVVETTEDVRAGNDFRWLTPRQLRRLLETDFAVNMDARSVMSCMPLPGAPRGVAEGPPAGAEGSFAQAVLESARPGAPPEHRTADLHRWLRALSARSRIVLVRRPVNALHGWSFDGRRLAPLPDDGRLAVGAVAVSAPAREVGSWTQPLLERAGAGRMGLLCQRRGGSLHVLAQATVEPGCPHLVQLSPTFALHDDWAAAAAGSALPPFASWFEDHAAPHVRFTALHSEEGGRFDRFVYRYTIAEATQGAPIDAPPTHRWLTLDQVAAMRRRGFASIELRSLTACLYAVADPA